MRRNLLILFSPLSLIINKYKIQKKKKSGHRLRLLSWGRALNYQLELVDHNVFLFRSLFFKNENDPKEKKKKLIYSYLGILDMIFKNILKTQIDLVSILDHRTVGINGGAWVVDDTRLPLICSLCVNFVLAGFPFIIGSCLIREINQT